MSAADEMAAFDQLPVRVRRRLADGARQISAVQSLAYLRRGIPEADVLVAIDNAERRIIADFAEKQGM